MMEADCSHFFSSLLLILSIGQARFVLALLPLLDSSRPRRFASRFVPLTLSFPKASLWRLSSAYNAGRPRQNLRANSLSPAPLRSTCESLIVILISPSPAPAITGPLRQVTARVTGNTHKIRRVYRGCYGFTGQMPLEQWTIAADPGCGSPFPRRSF
jgi:hypothetical protein